MELIFQEGEFLIKTLSTPEEMEAAFRLRHEVFCEELKWVPPSPDGIERDEYDNFAQSIGVFDGRNHLVCHVRLITPPNRFMIEREFACLLPKDRPFRKTPDMVESTRICVKRTIRNATYMSMPLSHLLYKAMYHWSLHNKVRYLITIVEKRYYVLLKRSKFPFEPIGDFLPLGDGVLSGIISLDWREFDRKISEKRPELFEWFIRLPAFDRRQLLLRELY